MHIHIKGSDHHRANDDNASNASDDSHEDHGQIAMVAVAVDLPSVYGMVGYTLRYGGERGELGWDQ